MQLAGDVRPTLALKDRDGNERPPVNPRAEKDNLRHRRGNQRKIGSYPVAKNVGERMIAGAHTAAYPYPSEESARAPNARASSPGKLDMRGKKVRAKAAGKILAPHDPVHRDGVMRPRRRP